MTGGSLWFFLSPIKTQIYRNWGVDSQDRCSLSSPPRTFPVQFIRVFILSIVIITVVIMRCPRWQLLSRVRCVPNAGQPPLAAQTPKISRGKSYAGDSGQVKKWKTRGLTQRSQAEIFCIRPNLYWLVIAKWVVKPSRRSTTSVEGEIID